MIETLQDYMYERESIRRKRLIQDRGPWTDDKILQTYKFTNVKRLHDRTTQYFMEIYKSNIYAPDYEALYNCGIHRYHGTNEFAAELGWHKCNVEYMMIGLARQMIDEGRKVYTGAYIITNGGRHGFKEVIVAGFLTGLWDNAHKIVDAIEENNSWEAGYNILRLLPGFGGMGFMAKEVLQDYILWRALAGRAPLADELSWTPVGPGARRGLNRVRGRAVRFQQKVTKFQEELYEMLPALQRWYWSTFSEVLSAHDVQFCLCEFDKYKRIEYGEGRVRAYFTPTEVK